MVEVYIFSEIVLKNIKYADEYALCLSPIVKFM